MTKPIYRAETFIAPEVPTPTPAAPSPMSLAPIIVMDLITMAEPAAKIANNAPIMEKLISQEETVYAPEDHRQIPAVANRKTNLKMNKLSKTLPAHKGFTLIELLLYVAIIGAVVFSIAGFLSLLMQSRVKNQTIAEVEQQGVQVMQIITQAGRNAGDINFTAAFDLSSGAIRENSIALTNSRVIASNLIFSNLSRAGTPGTVRIQFTITHVNPSGRNEYDYSKTFYASATIR
jgi:type II secretory pathway pseudopilin PulG